MKVLHIVSGDLSEGAARGAYWLHCGLIEKGVSSKVFTDSKTTNDDKNVISLSLTSAGRVRSMIRAQLDSFIQSIFYRKRVKRIFSTGMYGVDFTKTEAYREADIIHLHWINRGFVNIKHLSKIDKPIVWTIRDMWPLTGGCHYSMDCTKYESGCGSCPQLNSRYNFDLSRIVIKRKERYLPPQLRLVAISNWLGSLAKSSEAFKNYDIDVIPNNVNTAEFQGVPKGVARKVLGLSTDKKVVLIGANNVKDFYKGFSKFTEALSFLNVNDVFLCFFGKFDSSSISSFDFDYKSFGYLHDNISLSLLYSAADVFVAPSIMEAFGKTIVESMSCGTPVVCFDATGPKDIVEHKINGYKASPFDAEDLANGINWIIKNSVYDEMSRSAVERAVQEFDSSVAAEKYSNLYNSLFESEV